MDIVFWNSVVGIVSVVAAAAAAAEEEGEVK
jgi:hypothetical protein